MQLLGISGPPAPHPHPPRPSCPTSPSSQAPSLPPGRRMPSGPVPRQPRWMEGGESITRRLLVFPQRCLGAGDGEVCALTRCWEQILKGWDKSQRAGFKMRQNTLGGRAGVRGTAGRMRGKRNSQGWQTKSGGLAACGAGRCRREPGTCCSHASRTAREPCWQLPPPRAPPPC